MICFLCVDCSYKINENYSVHMYQINYYPTFSVLIFTFISSTNINDLMCIP